MKSGIVLKLFLLTTSLCMLILAVAFIGQTVFFKQFYVHQKVGNVQAALQSFEQDYLKNIGDPQTLTRLEQEFYLRYNTWITTLDAQGNLVYADDYYMEIKLDRSDDAVLTSKEMIVPLYYVINIEDFGSSNPFLMPWIEEGGRIAMEGVLINNRPVIMRMGRSVSNLREENQLENRQMVNKEYEVVNRYANPTLYHDQYPGFLVKGTITKVQIPEGAGVSRYTNHLFLDRIKAFQADLLYGDTDSDAVQVNDYEENQLNYKLFVNPVKDPNGNPAYLFAMTSLQPVNEAVAMMQDYYAYIIIAALLLALLASFYYSRRIARPLLRINRTTQQMARLDFSEKIPILTKDEIGHLSRNINELSERLHSYILRLEQDIEKERQLEQTRKEFISGVSHELKTPLSVIQSCLSILKDGVASHKREHYFKAMEDEVRRMDLLIVDMLELAKYESGTFNMNMEFFYIDDVIRRICSKLAPDIAAKQLSLHTSLEPVEVAANELRIEQVMINFLTNAIRYTPEQKSIIVTLEDNDSTVRICIENKGARIQDEQIEKIWDRFYRGEASRQRSSGGTGLGLAICKKILEMHGAAYGVTNTPDGVMFYFYLTKKT